MAYADTEVFTLDAASTALSDIIDALRTHFTSAPGRWELVSGVAGVAGESLAIVAKTNPTCHIGIRRQGTTILSFVVDPGQALTDAGDASTSPTASAVASPDMQGGTVPSINARFFLIECDNAIFVVLQDPAKNFHAHAYHVGRIYKPKRASFIPLGCDGHGGLVGIVSASGNNCWFPSFSQANGSRARVWNSGGAAQWKSPVEAYASALSTSASIAAQSDDGLIRAPIPVALRALAVDSSNALVLGDMDWVAAMPVGTAPSFPNQNPNTRYESPLLDNEAWLIINDSVSVAGIGISWQRGIAPS